jgi:ribose transport system substrate-binding protein
MTSRCRWAMLSVVLALLSGCGETKPVGKGKLLGVSFQTMNNPFFVELNEGLKKVIESHGDTLITLDAQYDSRKQLNDISDLIQQNAAAIFINPVNWEGIKGSLIKAKGKGIPCIIVDAPASDPELVLCTVASDNVQAGRLAAQSLFAAVPNAKVVILDLPINKACLDRVQGFEEELKKHPDAKVLDKQNGKGTTEGGRPVMQDLLGRFPDLNAVFAINDPSALGAISALDAAGKLKGVKVVSVDGSAAAADAIKAGKLLSTSAQFPREIGRIAAEQFYKYLDMQTVEKDIKVKVELVK